MLKRTSKKAVSKMPRARKISFSLAAPSAKTVLLVADFTQWEQAPVSLKKSKKGVWSASVSLSPGQYQYRFIVDGQWQDDPQCQARIWNRFGSQNCLCEVAG